MVHNYDPVATTISYMLQCVKIEKTWETTLQKTREALLQTDPRQLYLDFFTDLKSQIEQNSSESEILANLLRSVAIRGFGMSMPKHIRITQSIGTNANTQWQVYIDEDAVREHLDDHIFGDYFLNQVTVDDNAWGGDIPIIGGVRCEPAYGLFCSVSWTFL